MTDPIESIAQYIRADIERLRAAGHNAANANTPGHRATRTEAFLRTDGGDRLSTATRLDLSTGRHTSTGRSLDVALAGPGFLQVLTEDGLRLTRDGGLQLDADGAVVDRQGRPVMGEEGPIRLESPDVRIEADGTLVQAERVAGRLALVELADPGRLTAEGSGLYAYAGPNRPAEDTTVLQGALESSNLDPAAEMTRLIEISRHVESVQRALSLYDRMLGSGINDLGSNR